MEFRVLGRVEYERDNRPVPLGRRRERTLLALLLLQPGTVVPLHRLVDLLWDGDPPADARNTLRVHLSRLRASLAPDAFLLRRDDGYVADVEPRTVDAHRFRTLVDQAREQTDPGRRVGPLRAALDLWRGPLMAEDASDQLRARVGAELTDLRLTATELLMDAELERGRHAETVGELSALVAEHPLRERFVAQLMHALHRSGRQPEALETYQRLREALLDQLGLDPSADLQRVHTSILRGDGERRSSPTPAHLPPRPSPFVGREQPLTDLGTALTDAGEAAVVSVITGTGGVGKTALAVHWAHEVADRFPDGQLYINLRGFDPGEPVRPDTVLERFLRALGARSVPLDVDERTALYRSLLTGRQVLILLDNARTADQVRPLLPSSPGSLAVITSRNNLTGLVVRDGARRLALDRLPPTEATELLRRLLGPARVDRDPDLCAELVIWCAGLPLALRVAAERVTHDPDVTAAGLGAERLDLLDTDEDPLTSVRAVFSWSYRALPPEAAGLFRLLGLVPGPDFEAYAAANLAGTTVVEARRLLRLLTQNSLIEQTAPGRYDMHDLLRAYAAERAALEEPDPDAALTRLFDHYRHGAAVAMDVIDPHEQWKRPTVPPAGTPPTAPADEPAALAWLDAERPNLLAAAHHRTTHTADLATILLRYLDAGAHHTDALALNRQALLAATDQVTEATALTQLGNACVRLGHYEDAIDHYGRAIDHYRDLGDLAGEVPALTSLGVAYERTGQSAPAADCVRQVLAHCRAAQDRLGEARALTNLGNIHRQMDDLAAARDCHERVLTLTRELGHRFGESIALANLGVIHSLLGDLELSLDCQQRGLALYQELGHRSGETTTLNNLGSVNRKLGNHPRARDYHVTALVLARETGARIEQAHALHGLGCLDEDDPEHLEQAVDIYTELGAPEAEEARRLLADRRRTP